MSLPAHRIGRSEFAHLTGIKKTQFYNEYRWEPYWQDRFDMRVHDRSGRLSMSRKAVEDYADRRSGGRPATRPSQLSRNLGDHAISDRGASASGDNPRAGDREPTSEDDDVTGS